MNKFISVFTILMLITEIGPAQTSGWKIAGNRITTTWSTDVNPLNPLPEYPRPQMVRYEWKSLNGLWDYAINPQGEAVPKDFQGKMKIMTRN